MLMQGSLYSAKVKNGMALIYFYFLNFILGPGKQTLLILIKFTSKTLKYLAPFMTLFV
jgi:hypothetical protein